MLVFNERSALVSDTPHGTQVRIVGQSASPSLVVIVTTKGKGRE
jgi:hypothetical protein